MEIKVPSKFRELYQYESRDETFFVYHGGRAGGKSWEIARFLLIEAARKKHRVLCCREVMKSIKQSVHKLLSDQIQVLGLGGFYDILDTEIRGKNGSEFSFTGLLSHTVDSVKSFEGATITWIEEAQTISARSLEILIPTVIRTERPLIIFGMNPYLDSDPVYSEYVLKDRPDTFKCEINYTDNPHCPPAIIREAEEMRESDYEKFSNIWLGQTKQIADGAIYKNEFDAIRKENRICKVPVDPHLPVHTSWDLGILDSTAIWFWQVYGKEVRLVDYYEATDEPLAHYARILNEKGYQYGQHFAPHDIAARDLSSGVSREETMLKLGYRMTKGARLGTDDRIEAARQLLKNCWFDSDRCAAGIRSLQNYRRAYNEKMDQFKPQPVHDWASHGADAFGEGALSINKMLAPVKQTQAKPVAYRGRW